MKNPLDLISSWFRPTTGHQPTRRRGLQALMAGAIALQAWPANILAQTAVPRAVQHLANHAYPGGVALIEIGSADVTPRVTFEGRRVLVVPHESTGQWWAVVGIPVSTKSGTHEIHIDDGSQTQTRSFTLGTKKYPQQHITLKNKDHVTPPAHTLERIKTELDLQLDAYRTWSDMAQTPPLRFSAPVKGRVSSPFGFQRFFNGEPRNPHSGLDLAAPTGTPIRMPADGTVILIGDYFFNGLTVFVDHGMGVISMFCHMSEIERLPGERLKRGDIVGKVGATGRVTGPHLHWNVSLNDARVNPALFLE